jgi:hypothetical protein
MQGGGVCLTTGANSFIMRGGIIASNTAAAGGGVAVQSGTFTKESEHSGEASGIIYGSNGGVNRNSAKLAETFLQDKGHAVYVSDTMKRETTVLPDQTLDSTFIGSDGGWVD